MTDRILEEKKIIIQFTKDTKTKEKHHCPPWPTPELHAPTDADEEPQSMDITTRPGAVEPPPRRTWITE
jgi:hypothetical protein